MPVTNVSAIQTATRFRSTGGSRDRAVQSLVQGGANRAQASALVDEIDLQLGMEGRTLPDDVSPVVHHEVGEHRQAKRIAAEGAAAAVKAASEKPAVEEARHAVPTLAELSAGSTTPGRQQDATSVVAKKTDAVDGEEGISITQKNALRAQAMRRASRSSLSEKHINNWLVTQGMPEMEAASIAKIATERAAATQKGQQAQRRNDQLLGWLEIGAGVVLLIAGLAAGWFVGLFLVPIFDGFRRVAS